MIPLTLTLMLLLGLWAGYLLGLWWSRRSLDHLIEQQVARRGFQPSEEFLALLRRPTVDGVARRTLRKMGLCAYADILLAGAPITLVCHDQALLQRAVRAIIARKDSLEADMLIALIDARRAAGRPTTPADVAPDADVSPEELERRQVLRAAVEKETAFRAPPLSEPKVPAEPFKVSEGGRQS